MTYTRIRLPAVPLLENLYMFRHYPLLTSSVIGCFTLLALHGVGLLAEEWKSGIDWPKPPIVDPGPVGGPPSDAIVLFDGAPESLHKHWSGGEEWTFADGAGVCGGGITTRQGFGDCQLHVEFATPADVEGSGQGRGNSGVYLMNKYEVQILDSYDNETYFDGQAAAIYKQHPPLVNASRKPGEWQSYDIIFTAPRFDEAGGVKTPGYVTVLHNGVLVQNHFELQGVTAWDKPPTYEKHGDREPISIQFHGNPVRFRNIWIRDLAKSGSEVKKVK